MCKFVVWNCVLERLIEVYIIVYGKNENAHVRKFTKSDVRVCVNTTIHKCKKTHVQH